MPADDPFSFLENNGPPPERKPTKKAQWKEKLSAFSKDKGKKSSADQQIEAFLGPTRSKSVSHGHGIQGSGPRELPTPPGVSNRWTSSHTLGNAAVHSTPDFYPSTGIQRNRKPHKRTGMTVKFSKDAPELIGEGGDESEVPTVEVSLCRERRRHRAKSRADELASPQEGPPQLRLDTSSGDGTSGPRHQRQATGNAIRPDWKPPLITNTQDSDFLMTLGLGDSGSRLSFRGPPESSSFAERVRAKMQAEEGRALQHRYEDPPSPNTEDPEALSPPDAVSDAVPEAIPDSPSSSYETPPLSETEPVPPPHASFDQAPSPVLAHGPPSITSKTSPVDSLPSGLTPPGPVLVEPNLPEPTLPNLSPPKPQAVTKDPPLDGFSLSRPSSRDKRSPQPPKISLRSVANQFNDTAFTDLKEYAASFRKLIQLSAESVKPLLETSLTEWMRAAVWWFMRGKKRLETYARATRHVPTPGSKNSHRSSPSYAKQAVVDLGKALWIIENIVPQHEDLTRYGAMSIDALLAVASTTGDRQLADLLGLHQTLMNHLRSLAMSIKRNNIITTITENDSALQVDTSVWIRYPFFAPDVSAVLSGAATRSMLVDKSGKSPPLVHMMPLSDTNRFFTYGSMFVDVCVSSTEDDGQQQFSIPCVLSIIRERSDWYVFAAINSQSDLVNVMIQSDRKKGPTWDSVDWQVRTHSMRVKLPRGFELDIMFQDEDFKNLWNIVQYTLKTEKSLQPEAGETIIFENTLKVFSYMDPGTPKAFPAEPLERTRLRVFERFRTLTEGTGKRNIHHGYRLALLTSPKVKTLSGVRHVIGHGTPIVFGLLRGEDGSPALLLKINEDGRTRSMLMTFHGVQERTDMHSLLLGMVPQETEVKTSEIPTRAFSIEQPSDRFSGQPAKTHLQFPSGSVSVIDQQHAFVEHGYGPTVLSEHLRAFVATEWGSVTDRLNLGPGELKLGLDINNRTGLSLYRPAQQDLTVSVAENLVSPEMPDRLTEFLQKSMAKPMVRRFDFATVKDLHKFEAAVTGFRVLFDSVASVFSISRRRMVVPISKKWEATMARIQVVQQEKVVQLIAFLNDFNHGKCMNFVLKGTDHMEAFSRGGKYGVKIVDAKFALPKTDEDPGSEFVCLDMPEYPIEHDDITIAFDAEEDLINFQTAVPGSMREPSRMGSLRR